MTILSQIATVLKTTEKNVYARIAGMKLGPVCGRCGGTGQHSYNQINGSTCFGCAGVGHTKPADKQLPAVLELATAAANDGRLSTYIEYQAARVACRNAEKRILAALSATAVGKTNSAISHIVRDEELANLADLRLANRRMHDAYQKVSKATTALLYMKGDKQAATIVLAALVTAALAEIADASTYVIPQNLLDAAEKAKAVQEAYRNKMFGWR